MEEKSEKLERVYLDIDPEFSKLCPELDDEERKGLADSIVKEGCRDPIRYWESDGKRLVVDGHHRYSICIETGKLYETISAKFPDRATVIAWIVDNQLCRRNLTPVMKSMLLAKKYAIAKQADESLTTPRVANEPQKEQPKHRSSRNLAKQVAGEAGVSISAVYAATTLVNDLDKLGRKSPTLRDAARKGHIKKKHVSALAEAPAEVIASIEAAPDIGASAAAAAEELKLLIAVKPVIALTVLKELETTLGKVVRLKTEAFDACGGVKAKWPVEFEESLRFACNQGFEVILAWQKKAEEKGVGL